MNNFIYLSLDQNLILSDIIDSYEVMILHINIFLE